MRFESIEAIQNILNRIIQLNLIKMIRYYGRQNDRKLLIVK